MRVQQVTPSIRTENRSIREVAIAVANVFGLGSCPEDIGASAKRLEYVTNQVEDWGRATHDACVNKPRAEGHGVHLRRYALYQSVLCTHAHKPD